MHRFKEYVLWASTYLTLVNNVLRDLNEVELTSSTFSSSRGIQTSTKDYVNRAISDLINAELNWSFTRAEGSLNIIAGKQLYDKSAVSSSLKYVDYDTMFLEPRDFITNGDYEISGSASITGWTTVSGSPSASSKFGNTLLLTSAVVTQSVGDLVVGEEYIISTQITGSTATIKSWYYIKRHRNNYSYTYCRQHKRNRIFRNYFYSNSNNTLYYSC